MVSIEAWFALVENDGNNQQKKSKKQKLSCRVKRVVLSDSCTLIKPPRDYWRLGRKHSGFTL